MPRGLQSRPTTRWTLIPRVGPASPARAAPRRQLDGIIREFLSQTTVVAIDKLFSATGSLNGQAIVHFVRCLCLVSLEEVELQPRPRMYSLQKVRQAPLRCWVSVTAGGDDRADRPMPSAGGVVPPRGPAGRQVVEIAYYNMTRIRFEWTPLWQVLQPYFQKVGCHPNSAVATAAVDSLRQVGPRAPPARVGPRFAR